MPAATAKVPAQKGQAQASAILVPFVRAANEHIEVFDDRSVVLAASATTVGPIDISAYGFMRDVFLTVIASGGAGTTTVTALEDAPWSVFDEVTILDVNGAPIIGPLAGFDLYLINLLGGYDRHSPDPAQDPNYQAVQTGASASGNFAFQLRIPIEVSARDAFGSLPNQNAASTYKLRYTVAPSSRVYGTAPNTTLPTLRVTSQLNAWTQPTATDLRGNAQSTTPPAVNSVAYWSKATLPVVAGTQNIRLPRVGNYIRELIFIYRDATGSRANIQSGSAWPDPAAIYWDTRLLKSYKRPVWQNQMKKRADLTGTVEGVRGIRNGVYLEDYCHEWDQGIGMELRDGYLPTVQSTRLEIQGSFAVAGSLVVLTNDIAPQGDMFV